MIAVVQRVSSAGVRVDDQVKGQIELGLLILLGIGNEDSVEDVDWLSSKISNMRIFSDDNGKMNLSLKDVNGNALVISQFTLHALTKKGNRPSFTEAASPDIAVPLYENFKNALSLELQKPVESGEFGADMKVNLVNDGPVTIVIDTKNKK